MPSEPPSEQVHQACFAVSAPTEVGVPGGALVPAATIGWIAFFSLGLVVAP